MSYYQHLSKDKKLQKVLSSQSPIVLSGRKNIFTNLCRSIISQQLSVKVAAVIYQRFLGLFGGKEPKPQQVLATTPEVLRSIGLSNAKAQYVLNIAQFAIEKGMQLSKLQKMDNEEIINYLTQIKGVGRWTTEMLLMFTLGRENIFSVDDLGIQIAMIKIYKLDTSDKKVLKEKMKKISEKWHPYCTYACMHLWAWKDNSPG